MRRSRDIHHILSNFSWLLIDKIVRFGLTIVVTSLLARHLGPQGLGELNYAITFCAIFGFLATQGLDQFVVRELVRDPQAAPSTMGAVIVMRLIGGLICIAVAILAAPFFAQDYVKSGPLIAIISFSYLANAGDFADLWFQSQTRSKWSVLGRFFGLSLGAVLRVVMIWQGASIVAFAYAQVIELWATGLAEFYVYRRQGLAKVELRGSLLRAWGLIRAGWPLSLCSVFVLFYSRIDQLILAAWRPFAEVGLYTAATRIIDYCNIFPMILSSSVFPLMTTVYASGLERPLLAPEKSDRLERLLGAASWGAWLLAVVLFFSAPLVMALLYGPKFQDAVGILRILSWTLPLVFFSVIRHAWLTLRGQLGTALMFEFFVLLTSGVANLFLVPRMGAFGAAWAWVIATYFANLLGLIFLPALREPARLYIRSLGKTLLLMRRTIV